MLFKDFTQDINSHQSYRIKKLKSQLATAESYEEWKSIALKIDEESGAQEWKFDHSSPYFDAEMISYRLALLRRYRFQKQLLKIMSVKSVKVWHLLHHKIVNVYLLHRKSNFLSKVKLPMVNLL